MKRTIGLVLLGVVAVFAMVSCGGGGGGGDSVGSVTPQEELAGQYALAGFTLSASNGQTVTEQDATSWGGDIDIGHINLDFTLQIEGDITNAGGQYTVTWTSPTGGTINDGFDTISFTLSGGNLTWYYNNWDYGNGLTADMWIYWHKYSNNHTNLSPERESIGTNNMNISRSIMELMKSLVK